MIMIALSLLANVVLTFAVTLTIWRGTPMVTEAFGPDTPARRILACMYFTIGLASLIGLVLLGIGQAYAALAIVMVLLPYQIIYKLLTAPALGLRHPVVAANLGIVALHTVTLVSLVLG